MEPVLLSRYRPTIVSGLRRALTGPGPLLRIVRVHVGLEDESGAPVETCGKLIRPAIVLFITEELNGDPGGALAAAVSLELVHEFSLIHDDVQDRDEMRRGRPTVWSRWGEAQAINAGDLMLALALAEAVNAGVAVLDRLLHGVIEMVEGQALDVSFEACWPSVGEYTAMIDRKTGALFRCAWELGAILADAPHGTQERLGRIGRELGRAYQMRDDLLGIWGRESELGRPVGVDLKRRKKSYPVVSAADGGERRALESAFSGETGSEEVVERIIETMERLQVREGVTRKVNEHLARVLSETERLPVSEDGMQQVKELCAFLRPTMALGGVG